MATYDDPSDPFGSLRNDSGQIEVTEDRRPSENEAIAFAPSTLTPSDFTGPAGQAGSLPAGFDFQQSPFDPSDFGLSRDNPYIVQGETTKPLSVPLSGTGNQTDTEAAQEPYQEPNKGPTVGVGSTRPSRQGSPDGLLSGVGALTLAAVGVLAAIVLGGD